MECSCFFDEPTEVRLQVFVKLPDGETATLRFGTPEVSASELKYRIFSLRRIPFPRQRLLVDGHQLRGSSVVSEPDCTVHLLLRAYVPLGMTQEALARNGTCFEPYGLYS